MNVTPESITARLNEVLVLMKRIHGADWITRSGEYRVILETLMRNTDNKNVLRLALEVAKELDVQGKSPLMILAVAAEMASEPAKGGKTT